MTTVTGCPDTNAVFRDLAIVDAGWTDADTWELLRSRITSLATEGRERAALRHLLRLTAAPVSDTTSRRDEKAWRQRAAWKELGVPAPDQIRQDRDSEVINRLATHLLREIEVLAGERRALQGYGWPGAVRQEMLRRLERLPEHYPHHLTTSALAPLLHPQPRRDDPSPVDEAGVPKLPPLREDRSGDVDGVLRSPGARVLVQGGPGAGKSTMLRATMLRHMGETPHAVALFLPLVELADVLPEYALTPEQLLDAMLLVAARIYGPIDATARATLTAAFVERTDTLICLDGYDEAADGAPRWRLDTAIHTLQMLPGALVLSTRPLPRVHAVTAPGWDLVDMHPMPSGHVRTLLDLWFPDATDPRKERALGVLGRGLAVDIAGSPLLLGFVAYAASFDREFDTIDDLYDQYIALTLERIWKAAGGQEGDDVIIADLIGIATTLAWRMADGSAFTRPGAGPQYGRGWREVVTLDAILKVSKKRDRDITSRLVRAEGLFVIAEHAASRLHTAYRWVHRSVQEHLAGMYLLKSLQVEDPSAFLLDLEDLIARGDDWSVAISHLYAVLSDDARIALAEWLIAHEDDPKFVTGTTARIINKLAERTPENSRVDAHFHARRLAAGEWDARLYLEPEKTLRELLRAVADGEEFGQRPPDLSLAGDHVDAAYLTRLIAGLQEHPNRNPEMLADACKDLAMLSADDGVLAYVDAVDNGLAGLATRWDPRLRNRLDIPRVVSRIAQTAFPEPRWRLAHFFARTLKINPGPFIGDVGPLTPAEFAIGAVAHKDTTGDVNDLGQALIGMFSGTYGDVLAYLATQSGISADAVRGAIDYPWAVVGAWEYVLLTGGNPDGTALIRAEPQASEDVLAQFHPAWTTDAELMRRTYRAVADSFLFPDQVSVGAIVDMYRRVACVDLAPFDHVTARIDPTQFRKVLRVAVRHRGLEDIVEYILNTDPTDWTDTNGYIGVITEWAENVVEESAPDWTAAQYEAQCERVTSLFLRVVHWGAAGGIPTMGLFPIHTVAAPEVRAAILDRLDWTTARFPKNRAWLDRAMGLFGSDVWPARRNQFLAPILRPTGGQANDGHHT
ncbi:NACHT domain-containing NTPase [Microbacterium sp. JAI119]|uniref:NACHT domain-containing protein n=1 Tax=Microbacterium sp. JAI119 TaxID=2723062 RepID=UPI001806CDF2|nr:hypothetical protein [Microbacterium sp. JAI119]NYF28071.1 hypothetical protein [Microbacterium sp. JAI119]